MQNEEGRKPKACSQQPLLILMHALQCEGDALASHLSTVMWAFNRAPDQSCGNVPAMRYFVGY